MTSRIPNLAKVYKDLLATGWMTVDDRGYVNSIRAINDDGTFSTVPTEIGGKRMALPTEEVLSGKAGVGVFEIFHPLCELVTKGESPILAKLRHTYSVRINMTIERLFIELLTLAASRELHEKLNPDQAQILSLLKKVNMDNVLTWTKVIGALMKTTPIESQVVGLYIKKGARINNKDYLHGTIVYFDLFQSITNMIENWAKLDEKGRQLKGVSVTLDDLKAWAGLFKFILPNIDKEHGYSRGSDSDVAPRLAALCASTVELVSDIAAVLDSYRNMLSHETVKICTIEADWEAAFMDLGALRDEIRLIPAQALSQGSERRIDVATAQASVPAAPVNPAPQAQAAPAKAEPPTLQEAPQSNEVPFSQRLAQAQFAEPTPQQTATNLSATAAFFRDIEQQRGKAVQQPQVFYQQPVQTSAWSAGGWSPDGVIHSAAAGYQPQLVHTSLIHTMPVQHGRPVPQPMSQPNSYYHGSGL